MTSEYFEVTFAIKRDGFLLTLVRFELDYHRHSPMSLDNTTEINIEWLSLCVYLLYFSCILD